MSMNFHESYIYFIYIYGLLLTGDWWPSADFSWFQMLSVHFTRSLRSSVDS